MVSLHIESFYFNMKLVYKKQEYLCEVCGKIYKSWEGKNNHVKKYHPDFKQNLNCIFCNKEFKKPGAKGLHERVCKLNPNRKPLINNCGHNSSNSKIRSPYGTWYCKWCQEHPVFETRRELQKHNKEMHPSFSSWNKGLTKETSEIVKLIGEKCSNSYKSGKKVPYNLGKQHTIEEKEKIKTGIHKAKAEGKNVGGYREHKSGHGKKCIADGIFFDSSWEVAYWFYNKEMGNKLERNTKEFLYEYQNKTHRYLPDFFDGNNFIEIKGYEDDRCQAKYQSVDNLIVIKDVSKEINYMIKKYGKNWLNIVCEKVYN